jgi:hypothetical protein
VMLTFECKVLVELDVEPMDGFIRHSARDLEWEAVEHMNRRLPQQVVVRPPLRVTESSWSCEETGQNGGKRHAR